MDKIVMYHAQNTSAAISKERFIKLYEDLVCYVV